MLSCKTCAPSISLARRSLACSLARSPALSPLPSLPPNTLCSVLALSHRHPFRCRRRCRLGKRPAALERSRGPAAVRAPVLAEGRRARRARQARRARRARDHNQEVEAHLARRGLAAEDCLARRRNSVAPRRARRARVLVDAARDEAVAGQERGAAVGRQRVAAKGAEGREGGGGRLRPRTKKRSRCVRSRSLRTQAHSARAPCARAEHALAHIPASALPPAPRLSPARPPTLARAAHCWFAKL